MYILIGEYNMNYEKNYKLTSVKILDSLYKKFKVASLNDGLNFQKIMNRSISLSLVDENFRNKINSYND